MKRVITIGRQFGSGGREIGKRIAEALGITYYDKELLAMEAKASGMSAEYLENIDEKEANSFLHSLVLGSMPLLVNYQAGRTVETIAMQAQRDAVREAALRGSCVIVGRCADYFLRREENLTKLFICADEADQIQRVSRRENIAVQAAKEKIRRMNKARRSYYNFNTDQEWGAVSNYDLCVNVSRRGIDKTVELILDFIE